ncbi:MAG: alkaline phosphatase D family protein [Deltaproteobacteria bacterium]|nr:alkaline phosphatase D family protein [Deltaproteobacteria bacterium]MBW2361466.1 alkaline phosphatase D family protein [Deltaproteobacteria bacterium]
MSRTILIGEPRDVALRVPRIQRRAFLRGLAASGVVGAALPGLLACTPTTSAFPDGVKCGDPRPYEGRIWTRVPAPADSAPVAVTWMVSEDADFGAIVAGGVAHALAENGHTLKIEVPDLRSDRWYFYRFESAAGQSAVGRMRTAPPRGSHPDRLRYAFASCQQRSAYYVAHRSIAQEDIDFMMHLGDYIYANDTHTRSLDDYRKRYQLFHSDPDLQALQAHVPLVAMWDDGEFWNGVDHLSDPPRLAAAERAFTEYMPIPSPASGRIFRGFEWGRLAEVFMIDSRSERDPAVPPTGNFFDAFNTHSTQEPGGRDIFDPDRTALGDIQRQWLKRRLAASRGAWKMIGNPYQITPWKIVDFDLPGTRPVDDPNFEPNAGIYIDGDGWDMFQAERRELLEHIEQQQVENVVFTSGHTHIYLTSELHIDFDDPASVPVAADFVTGSLTADPDPLELAPLPVLHFVENLMLKANEPYMKHVDIVGQGYALVDLTPDELIVEYKTLDTLVPDSVATTKARFRMVSGSSSVERLL